MYVEVCKSGKFGLIVNLNMLLDGIDIEGYYLFVDCGGVLNYSCVVVFELMCWL